MGAYGATKAGLAYWNDALRRELFSKGVAVCLVEPGPIKTEFMDSVNSLVPSGEQPAAILDNAAPWMTADVEQVARRVARLLDRPRRRLSVLRRFVWLFRLVGVAARLCPPLGDRLVASMQDERKQRTEPSPAISDSQDRRAQSTSTGLRPPGERD